MRKTVLLVLMVSMLLLGPAVFAQDKPADQSGSSQPAAGRRFSELSPEEQAKLRAKWQSASPEEKAKARETARAAGTAQGPQSQMRKELLQAEINKLQEQHKMSVGELQAVKQIAVKENAKETAEALTQLIAKHESQFNQQMQVLQRRMKALQGDKGAQTGEAGQTPAGKAKTPESKKNGAKSQSTGTKK
jgi:hypothetical protein